jgi:CheY-like chemotaxis protein
LLLSLGYVAHSCTGGQAALSLAAEFLTDAALIDLHMPGLHGHEVARRLRAIPGLEHSLLIAMTGLQPGDRRRAPGCDFD